MKPITLFVALSLMVPVALRAQEPQVKTRALIVVSPIMNRAPTPSMVRTAERFSLVYEIRALRKTDDGDEVEFRKGGLTPDNISLGSFVADKVTITELPIESEYRVWRMEIVAYIIAPKKSDPGQAIEYAIPPIRFEYVVKPVGGKSENLKVLQFLSEAVPIQYGSSVAENTKYPDIQDRTDDVFPVRKIQERLLGYYPWAVLLLGVVFIIFQIRKFRRYREGQASPIEFIPEDLIPDEVYSGPSVLSRKEARRRFYRNLRALRRNAKVCTETEAAQREVQRDIRGLLKMLLLAEIPNGTIGLTDEEIHWAIENRVSGRIKKSALIRLAAVLLQYRGYINEGGINSQLTSPSGLRGEIRSLKKAARKLGLPWSLVSACFDWCSNRYEALKKLFRRKRR